MAGISSEQEAAARIINPLLLVAVRKGMWEALDFLFQREDAQEPPMVVPTEEFRAVLDIAYRRIGAPSPSDAELGVNHQPAPLAAGALLQGVTPNGDTALHAVAGSGDGENFLRCAAMICDRDMDLLFSKNHNGDTPLHCAARAGNSKMVSRLIALAGPGAGGEHPDGKLKLLRMENKRHETALHEAIRIEDGRILGPKDREALFQADHATAEKITCFVRQQKGMTIVKQLMGVDPRLANYPANGISPLCLAILLEKGSIALTLYHESGGNLSYCGSDGQNALHVALHRDKDTVMKELLLDWNKNLTTQVDKDGSTPLHFALTMNCWTGLFLRAEYFRRPPRCKVQFFPRTSSPTLEKVLKANPAALYQADKNGFFPIHVAASVGASNDIRFLLQKHPDNAGLRDAKGKTFLHVAVEKARPEIVSFACGNQSLAWILNIQDNDGNTALHLAIQSVSLKMFCALFGNRDVNLNLTNNQGETPHDLSRSILPRGLGFGWNPETRINHVLKDFGASQGSRRWDKNEEKYSRRPMSEDKHKESEKLKDTAQNYIVPSVLIATMAFTAAFAIPGGYRADDHTNGGTPILAGRYIFDAFIMATTLAFICSTLATVGYMFAGHPVVNLSTRTKYIVMSSPLMLSAVTCLAIAFALAVYMVLAPIAPNTAIVVCVYSCDVGFDRVGKDPAALFIFRCDPIVS
ncbi:ankyrin repeat-containing protein At2g01680-like [Lolium rigidum]|uniref:ankyrin repeat-containing protein At2g01680-like n=1 Tax=Lolium rigidum TaxID=89674 RepID=UPI001F5C3FFA|nr:ankyrin repeat-containing protein At2g01680-like [Lolium rigidum]